MLVGLVYLLYHVSTKRAGTEPDMDTEDVEESGY